MLDLSPEQLDEVRGILRRRVPAARVLAFGSRATRRARRYSDLDLALAAAEAVPYRVLFDLEEDFSESDLPFRVDIVDLARVDEAFRQRVLNQCLEIQPGGQQP